jgi:hypothetical protein
MGLVFMKCFLLALLLPAVCFGTDPISIADFEDQQPKTGHGAAITLEITTDKQHVKEGEAALKIVLDHDNPSTSGAGWKIPSVSDPLSSESTISFWIKGEGPDTKLQFSLTTQDKGNFAAEKTVSGAEWQEIVIPFSEFQFNKHSTTTPPEAAQELDPSSLFSFGFIDYRGLNPDGGQITLYLDAIRLNP